MFIINIIFCSFRLFNPARTWDGKKIRKFMAEIVSHISEHCIREEHFFVQDAEGSESHTKATDLAAEFNKKETCNFRNAPGKSVMTFFINFIRSFNESLITVENCLSIAQADMRM